MINKLLFCSFFFVFVQISAQSFAPAPGEVGSTAIYKDSSIFVNWAKGINVQRGFQDISNQSLGLATFGTPENALNKAEGNSFDVVSLGDSGIAILTFEFPIINGPGFDFAIFENAFADNLLELAFVEVSSDGVHFARFPAVSEIPLNPQLTGFEYVNCAYVNNLAGKYRQGFGTPFDLDEINDPNVDVNNITHVKIIDVIGSIDGIFSSLDVNGNIINDPFPTPFESSGFDLDGVGVIHQKNIVSIVENEQNFSIFPNPFQDYLIIESQQLKSLKIYNQIGKIIYQKDQVNEQIIEIDTINFAKSMYYLELDFKNNDKKTIKLLNY
jgi:hypothetical protein